jgi:acyl-coenzyme A synthetase/AMP-(fatty) acid ligase
MPMTTAFPLTRHRHPDACIAIGAAGSVRVATFLRDAAALAQLLPATAHIVNLCADRYRFTVGLAAALLRRQITLLPPSDNAPVLSGLREDFPDAIVLHDRAAPDAGMPSLAYPDMTEASGDAIEMPLIPADQPAIVLFTSGSTGRPVPHGKSWGSLVGSAIAAGRALEIGDLADAAIIATVPQQHSYGFESTVMLPLQHGLALHRARPFYPADIVAAIEAAPRPRVLVTSPVHLRALLADAAPLPPLDLIVSATAPLARELAIDAEHAFATRLVEIYGCSEAGQLATRRTARREEWRCMAGIALRQEDGETYASGPTIAGEIALGDVIDMTGERRFRLHGRNADLVNIGGKRTSLDYLNHHLNAIEGVEDGIFILPDDPDDGSARLVALVVAPTLTAETIMRALRVRIDPVFLPRPLRLLDALPRNAVGKLTREAALRAAQLPPRRFS